MIRTWLNVALVLGVCWLGACDDTTDPPDQAETPARDDSNEGRRPAADDDPFDWGEAPALTDEDFTPVDDTPADTVAGEDDVSDAPSDPPAADEATTWENQDPAPSQPTVVSDEPAPADDPFAWADDAPELTDEELAAADQPSEPADAPAEPADEAPASADVALAPVLQLTMTTIDGRDKPLADYEGKVLLIVNTASQCGFTDQYAGLQALHEQLAEHGLAVLGFPANNFNNQEPGTDGEIATFCQARYGVSFDMFSKISVSGDDRHALYDLLTAADAPPVGARPVGWNFEKFLVARDGTVVGHYYSSVAPGDPVLVAAIQRELDK